MSRIPAIQTQLRFFHAPQEEKSDFRPFMEYLNKLQENVKKYLFDELPLENTTEIEEIINLRLCVPSVAGNRRTTRLDITHMWQVNTPQGRERYSS